LTWTDAGGVRREESWDDADPWRTLLEVFEAQVAQDKPAVPLTWQDAVRCLELDDAARRSVERRRSSVLEYQEATEEVGFKGTMTLVGCGLFWVVLGLVIASRWVPALGWLIVPLLVGFLGLQLLLRWILRRPSPG
jgi:hypothetical protein